jgi:sugar transferase EpsL
MIKRLFDIFVSAVMLLILSPVILVVAILVRMKLGSPILFTQIRPGKSAKLFKVYKFRTMTNQKDAKGELLPDALRLTRFGQFLRSSSLDELPQLFNVFKGDISLVGPRPLLVEYLPLYSSEQARRHEVRPGITGWAQINGRNAISWEEKFKLDIWYVDHQSFFLDMKILWKTLLKVLKKEGIASDSHVTMPKFMGSEFQNKGYGG